MGTSTKQKGQQAAAGTSANELTVLGVLAPTGKPERVDQLYGQPKFWDGPAFSPKQGKEVGIRATMVRTVGSQKLTISYNRSRIGELERVNNHYEGQLGDRAVGAFFRSINRGHKSGLRIVIVPVEQLNARSEKPDQTAKRTTLKDAIAEIGDLGGSRQDAQTVNEDIETPF